MSSSGRIDSTILISSLPSQSRTSSLRTLQHQIIIKPCLTIPNGSHTPEQPCTRPWTVRDQAALEFPKIILRFHRKKTRLTPGRNGPADGLIQYLTCVTAQRSSLVIRAITIPMRLIVSCPPGFGFSGESAADFRRSRKKAY